MKIKVPWDTKSAVILITLSFFLISGYALINSPGPFEWVLIDILKIDTYSYGILVSLCSWASLFDICHGYLLDRYLGIKLATWIYSVFVFVGNALYCIAGFSRTYWLMILGRVIFGLGVNPLVLLSNKHVIHWFGKGKYVNFIYSLCESIFWLGSAIIFLVTVPIMDSLRNVAGKERAFAITNAGEVAFFTVMALAPMIIAAYMYDRKDEEKPAQETSTDKPDQNAKVDRKFSEYVCLPLVFWLFAISVFIYYVSILSFISLSVLFFKTQYKLNDNESSTLSGLISLMPAILSPFFGLVLDKIGHNLSSFTSAVLLNLLALGLLTWTSMQPLIPVIAMGISLVTSSGIWSQFQFLVEEHQYMIAYGVAQTGLNGAQAVGTMIAGYIIDKYGYEGYMIFQFSVILCSVPTLALVWALDIRKGNFLNLTSSKKNQVLGRTPDSKEQENSTEKDL